jgi:hypothetical protein
VKITLGLCVFMFCSAWLAINLSHDAVKNRELDVQLEMAKAIGRYGKPSLSIEPGEKSGKDRL